MCVHSLTARELCDVCDATVVLLLSQLYPRVSWGSLLAGEEEELRPEAPFFSPPLVSSAPAGAACLGADSQLARGSVAVKWEGSGKRAQAATPYLVDAELALEAAACSVVQGDLHGVVDVAHFMPAHLILNVKPNHCGGKENSHPHPCRGEQPASAEAPFSPP